MCVPSLQSDPTQNLLIQLALLAAQAIAALVATGKVKCVCSQVRAVSDLIKSKMHQAISDCASVAPLHDE